MIWGDESGGVEGSKWGWKWGVVGGEGVLMVRALFPCTHLRGRTRGVRESVEMED